MAAAERLVDAINYDSLMDRTVAAMIADQQKSFPQRLEAQVGKPLPDDLKAGIFELIATSIRTAMSESRADMRRGTALIYASRFTATELDHLAAMQRDPVMIKMQSQLPQIAAESAALGRAAVEREQPRMLEAIKKYFERYEREKGWSPGS